MSTFLTTGALKQDIVEIVASASSLQLTSLSPAIMRITGTVNQTITFPSALTLETGINYVIINDSSATVTIQDYDATVLGKIARGFAITFYLVDKVTAAGTWSKATTGGGAGITSVRAADFTTTVLPTGLTLEVDGVTIVDDDLVLFGNAALNRVYRVTGIGSSLVFEEAGVFADGSVIPAQHDAILVREGTEENCTIWLSDSAFTPPWHKLYTDGGGVAVTTSATIQRGFPVTINTLGQLALIDITNEVSVYAFCGVTSRDSSISTVANVLTAGSVLTDIPAAFGLTGQWGKPVFVSHNGTLTTIKPVVGLGDFVSLDYVLYVGVTTKNPLTGTTDLILNPRVIGQLA